VLFSEIIKQAREAKGYSIQQAADLLGCPKTTLWRLENDQGTITADRIIDIASKYGYSISSLLEGRLVIEPTETDYERLGMVVEEMERVIQRRNIRPNPTKVRTAVVEVLRLETTRVIENPVSKFDPARYNTMVEAILGSGSE
jgi:transcriptional regulator with XRE-family HTH domain